MFTPINTVMTRHRAQFQYQGAVGVSTTAGTTSVVVVLEVDPATLCSPSSVESALGYTTYTIVYAKMPTKSTVA